MTPAGIRKHQIAKAIFTRDGFSRERIALLKQITSAAGRRGIYVTVHVSAKAVRKELKDAGFDDRGLFFIDGISKPMGLASTSRENTYFLQGPNSLTELSIKLDDLIQTGRFDHIVFDSFCALLVYNDPEAAIRFVRRLFQKVRYQKLTCAIICMQGTYAEKMCPKP